MPIRRGIASVPYEWPLTARVLCEATVSSHPLDNGCAGDSADRAFSGSAVKRDYDTDDLAVNPALTEQVSGTTGTAAFHRPSAHLIRVPEAARLTGLPRSTLRKCFMAEHRRPKTVPAPPPHKRIGRSVYILADRLPGWVESLGGTGSGPAEKRRRGRPTVAERIARRQRMET